MISSVLRANGYNVLEAPDGATALRLFERERERVDLILTDVAMPRMNGRELAERVSELRGACPVVFMSGYMEDPFVESVVNGNACFLRKPFTAQSLVDVIRRNLERGRAVGKRPPEPT